MSSSHWSRSCEDGGEAATPWLVPQTQRLELLFFRKVFQKLRECAMQKENVEEGDVPLLLFQRTMSRLFLFLREDREFNSKEYDMNCDGMVSWWEFCLLWKQEELTVELSFAERLHLTLEDPQASKLGRLTSIFILLAIALSAGGFIISTLPEMQYQCCATCAPKPERIFGRIDTVCVIIFTIEYVLRLATAACMRTALMNQEDLVSDICTDEAIPWPTRLQRARAYMCQWPNLIDLLAILPSYIDFIPTGEDCPEASGGGNGTWAREILPIIRLMRVVRAFRLGKRLEAIIIIARSMQRSLRAVEVLILNVFLGVIIFGAIMFFLEQGTYCPWFGAYMRFSGTWSLADDSGSQADEEARTCLSLDSDGDYREDWERSPFESIPHSFWWALVTATTVGFGDDVPATKWGKIVAAVAMVWSLCVLALPIGVIGDNFGHVWDEYDAEKVIEHELHEKERQMARDAVVNIDPLVWSRVLRLEVFHNSFMATIDNDVFLGEVECELQLEAGSTKQITKQLSLPLCPNLAKSDRSVSGRIFMSYTWTPKESCDPQVLLQGSFTLKLERVEGLVSVDWKANGLCDAYVRVTTFPRSPDEMGVLHPQVTTTATKMDDANPVLDATISADFYWHQAGINAKVGENRRILRESLQNDRQGAQARIRDTVEANAELVDALPKIEADVAEVQRAMLQMQSDVVQVRDLTKEIGEYLNLRDELAVRAPYRTRNRPSFIMSHANTCESGPSPRSRKIADEASDALYRYAATKHDEQDQQWLLDTAVKDEKAGNFAMPGAVADMEH